MFTVNHQSNRISPVKVKTFSELGFTERKHLQLCMRSGLRLAHQPDAQNDSGHDVVWQALKSNINSSADSL